MRAGAVMDRGPFALTGDNQALVGCRLSDWSGDDQYCADCRNPTGKTKKGSCAAVRGQTARWLCARRRRVVLRVSVCWVLWIIGLGTVIVVVGGLLV